MSADRATQVLSEFEGKALGNLVQSFRSVAGSNALGGTVMIFQDQMSACHNVVVSFKLNGKEFTCKKAIDRDRLSNEEAKMLLFNSTADAIAVELLGQNTKPLKEFLRENE